jgi:hypothetical protein
MKFFGVSSGVLDRTSAGAMPWLPPALFGTCHNRLLAQAKSRLAPAGMAVFDKIRQLLRCKR